MEQRTEPMAPEGHTAVDVTRYTRVRVEGTDGGEVALGVHSPELDSEAIRRLLESIEIRRQDGDSAVRLVADGPRRPRERRFFGLFKRREEGPWAELRLALPRRRAVELVLGPGTGADVAGVEGGVEGSSLGNSLYFSQIAGGIRARVRGGQLHVRNVRGAVELEAKGGGVRVWEVDGPLSVRAAGGGLILEAIRGDLKAVAAGGGIEVRDAGGTVEATASGGSVAVRQSAPPAGEHRVKAVGGDVVLHLPTGSGGFLSARAVRGRITARLDGATVRGDRNLERDLGGGGPRLDLRTNGGDVRVWQGGP